MRDELRRSLVFSILFCFCIAGVAPAVADDYYVQVTSQRSEGEALAAFRSLQAKYPSQLSGREVAIHKLDLGAQGTYYRGMVGPFTSSQEAAALCSNMMAAGGICLVQVDTRAAPPGTPKVASDHPANCKAIEDAKARLACFDKAAQQPQQSQKKAEAPRQSQSQPQQKQVVGTAAERETYRADLRRTFLASGLDIDVLVDEKARPNGVERVKWKYPRLMFFGYLNAPAVYQLITNGKVLENAKEKGFLTIDFFSKSSDEGHWYYDLSGQTIPRCDINHRLCI
jgi:hypothetical protein